MLQPIRDYPQRQNLSLGDGIMTRFPARHDAGKVGYFRDPSAVCFSINFNLHEATSFEKPTQRFDLSQAALQATAINPHMIAFSAASRRTTRGRAVSKAVRAIRASPDRRLHALLEGAEAEEGGLELAHRRRPPAPDGAQLGVPV
jgi:hypothetical protein